MKELTETTSITAFRTKFEACRSFDLEDDMEFCPNLLTDNDVSSSNASRGSSPVPAAQSDSSTLVELHLQRIRALFPGQQLT